MRLVPITYIRMLFVLKTHPLASFQMKKMKQIVIWEDMVIEIIT